MSRGFEFRASRMVPALALMAVGVVAISFLRATPLVIGGSNFTSIGMLLGGLMFYSGVLVVVGMFKNEIYLAFAILLPSIVAVAIFV